MSCSTFSCSHFSPNYNPQTISKRLIQERKPGEEERVVVKSTPMWSLVSKTVDRSPLALGSSSSHSPGTLKAQSSNLNLTSTGRPVARGSNENTASSSLLWHSDVNPNTSTRRPVTGTTKNPVGTKFSHHNLEISPNYVGYVEIVYSNVRLKLG